MDIFDKYRNNIQILPCDDGQRSLVKKHIEPHLLLLYEYAHSYREKLDKCVLNGSFMTAPEFKEVSDKIKLKLVEYAQKSHYPIGACYQITAVFYDYILNDLMTNSALVFLKKFMDEGGIFKITWGNARNECFQTALQVGNYCYDVANDTVSLKKDKVLIAFFPDLKYKNISSIEEYILLKKVYHNQVCYPNFLLPHYSPLFPVFIEKNNQIFVGTSYALFCNGFYTGFSDYLSFMRQRNAEKVPARYKEEIETFFNKMNSVNSSFAEVGDSPLAFRFPKTIQEASKMWENAILEVTFFNQRFMLKNQGRLGAG